MHQIELRCKQFIGKTGKIIRRAKIRRSYGRTGGESNYEWSWEFSSLKAVACDRMGGLQAERAD